MTQETMAARQERLALADYEGWVAWLGETPVFEARPWRPELTPLRPDAEREEQYRRPDRQTVDWEELPHEKVTELELYFARKHYPKQPVVRLSRWPDAPMRWIQQKMRAIQVEAMVARPEAPDRDANVHRTRVQGYRMGYYNPAMADVPGPPDWRTAPTLIIEVTRQGMKRRAYNCHPCWPRPHGLGMHPKVLGLTKADVPPVPTEKRESSGAG